MQSCGAAALFEYFEYFVVSPSTLEVLNSGICARARSAEKLGTPVSVANETLNCGVATSKTTIPFLRLKKAYFENAYYPYQFSIRAKP